MPPREPCEEKQNVQRCEQQQNAQAQELQQQPQQLQEPQQPLEPRRRRVMIGNEELDEREEAVILAIARNLLAAERGEV
ncbi:unnamed protein product [Caenorhabditis angaria]|uniref:Uncharacterized protein n=1 Tax=Caenorhabditis angaria TaxID=860376 RepID=A0A9P1NB17_9PELO|nr:unnamed protein product [Caenorhabditis angaria]